MSGWFSLEAVFAKKGDALILHYGSKTRPRWILIDGGHTGVYEEYLRPRLEELRSQWPSRQDHQNRLPLEMVMVSHADADHIKGILDLTEHMLNQNDPGIPNAPVNFDKLWFNGFEDLIANPDATPEDSAIAASILDSFAMAASSEQLNTLTVPFELKNDRDVSAVVASTRQGRQLLKDADALAIDINPEFDGQLIMRGGEHSSITRHSPGGLTMQIIGPDKNRIDRLRNKWAKDLKNILKKEQESANAASFKDASPFNLASTMVLIKRNSKTMLLTGDGRGDDLIEGLEAEGLLDANNKIAVDVFKLPHHGSNRNVKVETFRDITAKHYLISANGEHGNPEPDTLDMLVNGRAQTRYDTFTVYLTFEDEAFKLISEELADQKKKLRNRKDALQALDIWLKTKKPDNMEIVYRNRNDRSVVIDLGAENVIR